MRRRTDGVCRTATSVRVNHTGPFGMATRLGT